MLQQEQKQDAQSFQDDVANQEKQNQTILDEEMETVYLYVYDQDPEQPFWQNWHWPHWNGSRLLHLLMQVLAVTMLAGFWLVPGTPLYQVQTLTVPAIFLPVQQFKVTVAVIPTGKKTSPATQAHGILTLYNGSILSQVLPQGFLFTAKDGTEVSLESAVTIPAGDAPTYGTAQVQASAVLPGSQGNLPAYAIDVVYGSDLYIKNVSAFTGGQDAQTEHYITNQDTARALDTARQHLQEQQAREKHPGFLAKPCTETERQAETSVSVLVACQYVTYKVPAHATVVFARISGKSVMLQVETLVQPS